METTKTTRRARPMTVNDGHDRRRAAAFVRAYVPEEADWPICTELSARDRLQSGAKPQLEMGTCWPAIWPLHHQAASGREGALAAAQAKARWRAWLGESLAKVWRASGRAWLLVGSLAGRIGGPAKCCSFNEPNSTASKGKQTNWRAS